MLEINRLNRLFNNTKKSFLANKKEDGWLINHKKIKKNMVGKNFYYTFVPEVSLKIIVR